MTPPDQLAQALRTACQSANVETCGIETRRITRQRRYAIACELRDYLSGTRRRIAEVWEEQIIEAATELLAEMATIRKEQNDGNTKASRAPMDRKSPKRKNTAAA